MKEMVGGGRLARLEQEVDKRIQQAKLAA